MTNSTGLESPLGAIIVGGSLAGLTAALAMARIGIRVTVLDRGANHYVAGSGLWVDADALHDTIGAAYRGPSGTALGVDVAGGRQYALAWAQLHAWLRDLTAVAPLSSSERSDKTAIPPGPLTLKAAATAATSLSEQTDTAASPVVQSPAQSPHRSSPDTSCGAGCCLSTTPKRRRGTAGFPT